MLCSHPQIASQGEIFNETNPRSYFHYLEKVVQQNSAAVFPTRSVENLVKYLQSSFEVALQRTILKVLVLDVKYDQSHLICEPWWTIGALPRIFSFIRETGCKVIDVRRDDLAAMVISNQIAIRTKIYHREKAELGPSQNAKIWINPDRLIREMTSTAKAYDMIAKHFRGYSSYMVVKYEQMFDGELFSTEVVDSVASFLEVEDRFDRRPQFAKVLDDDVLSHVENAAEVRQFLNDFDRKARLVAAPRRRAPRP